MRDRAQKVFDLDTTIVSALPDGATLESPPEDRARVWRRWRRQQLESDGYVPEYLLPRITRRIEREWPAYMSARGQLDLSREALVERVAELGPWRAPFVLDHEVVTNTRDKMRDRILFRRELITGTVAAILGDSLREATVLDIGCNCGFFSLDLAARGAKHVHGIDLRPENIAQARFVAEFYGIENVTFATADVDEFAEAQQWDVVLNLGVLYHVTNPLDLIRRTHQLCRQLAVVDTKTHWEPTAAYLLRSEVDIGRPTEGRDTVEFHPTYRAAIETILHAGFSDLVEVVGHSDPPHDMYANGNRRCFLAAP